MVLEALHDCDGKAFCNVVTDDLGFETDEEKKAAEERDLENKDFLDFVKESLGERMSRVKFSSKLADLPCAMSTEGPVTLEMEKYFRRGPSEEMRKVRASRVLELNAESKAVKAMKEAWESDKEKAGRIAGILASLAELTAGADLDDPAALARGVEELF